MQKMTKRELVKIAKNHNIPLKHNISKAELIELLDMVGEVDEGRNSYRRKLVLTNTLTGEKQEYKGYPSASEALGVGYTTLRYRIDQKTTFRTAPGEPKIWKLEVYDSEIKNC